MAHRLSITTVEFRPRNRPGDDPLPLGDLDGDGKMALEFFREHLLGAHWIEGPADPDTGDPTGKHAVKGINRSVATGNAPDTVASMMLAGERGIVATYYDGSFERPVGQRDENTIEAPEVLALAHMPMRQTRGFLVSHGYHGRYFKSGLLASVRHAASIEMPELTLSLETWAPAALIGEILKNGTLLSIELERRQRVDGYEAFTHSSAGDLKLVLTPDGKDGAAFNPDALIEADGDSDALAGLLNVADIQFHDLAVNVKIGGSTRRFLLGAPNDEWVSWDATEDVGNDGSPDPSRLVGSAVSLLRAYSLMAQ